MKLAVIVGPYRAETDAQVHDNIQAARKVAEAVWKKGYAVICPHLNSAFMSGVVDEKQFLEAGLEFVRRADIVVVATGIGWNVSDGTQAEICLASELSKPTFIPENVPEATKEKPCRTKLK